MNDVARSIGSSGLEICRHSHRDTVTSGRVFWKAGNHEMSDRQTNAMQDADFIPWKKWQGFDR
jgi:hypothetical protein